MGMSRMMRSNQPLAPMTKMTPPLSMNAPMASPMLKCPVAPALAKTAAPDELQATITGLRSHSEGTSVVKPIPSPMAQSHEASISGVAPKDSAAWKTMAMELATPTSTETKPAVTVERLRSLKNCTRGTGASRS